MVPSVAWMLKSNTPTVLLATSTVIGPALLVDGGVMLHVEGGAVAPAVQVRVTVPVYPLKKLSVPLRFLCWLTKAVIGELLTDALKSFNVASEFCHTPRP